MNSGEPEALRALASLLRSGLSLRQAVLAWPRDVDEVWLEEVEGIASRVALGMSVPQALAGSPLEPTLSAGSALYMETGSDLAAWLEARAHELQKRSDLLATARAASSGAVLSGRMVAGLPLLFVPLTPMTAGKILDGLGLVMIATGVALAIGGLRWIGRLVPAPPENDATSDLCEQAAALLNAGLALVHTIELVLRAPPPAFQAQATRAAQLAGLGHTWSEALLASGPDLGEVARSLVRAQRFGTPAAEALTALAYARRDRCMREFERRMRRAPVLMVIPLVCCVLPAYGLLGLAPFIRSIGLG